MPRGGKRDGSGRPSTWSSGCRFQDTKLIRVPKSIADRVLKYAHDVDMGRDLVSEVNLLQQENKLLNEQIDLLIDRNEQLCEKLSNLKFGSKA
ncbi:MAG: hypothetical protein F6K31_30975 [Symploca sp. SIO2G7]|nr:hypothetical protein [Symploca sp. SIO2G7]